MTKKIWAPGVVKRVADGLTHTADGKHNQAKVGGKPLAIKSILPAGALLWAWEADKKYEEKAGEQVSAAALCRCSRSRPIAHVDSLAWLPCAVDGTAPRQIQQACAIRMALPPMRTEGRQAGGCRCRAAQSAAA